MPVPTTLSISQSEHKNFSPWSKKMAQESIQKKFVAVLVYPGVSMLELTGVYSTFNGLKMGKYEVAVVAEGKEAVLSDTPLKIAPHNSMQEIPNPSILIVMGGGMPALYALGNLNLRQYIWSAAQGADHIIGIGTGALLLAVCGLLKGRQAATHWALADLLEYFGARFKPQPWVEDGKLITTRGGTAGMDMGLQFLSQTVGENNARLLQLFAEYDPEPPFGGIDWKNIDENTPLPFSQEQIRSLQSAVADEPEIRATINRWADRISVPA
jgi:transcriptional regulator GlxA family with amidase domain